MSFDPRTEYRDPTTAESYDRQRFRSFSGRLFQWTERRSLARIAAALPAGSRVLDAPCGTGRLTDLYLRRGLTAIGADISAEMITVARRRTGAWNGRVSFCQMDFVELPLADRSVTAVSSIRFLPHMDPVERVKILREFRRVSQGWVIISLSLSSPWHRLRRRIKEQLGHPKPVRHPVTSLALAQELHQAGLREVSRHWTFPLLSEQLIIVCEPA